MHGAKIMRYVPPLPHYIFAPCYIDHGHCTNANYIDFASTLLSDFIKL
jgi:hypothetical protein